MITRTNHFKQSLQKTNLNRIFQITFYISRQNAKHVINILSQQFVLIFTASKFSSKEAHQSVLIATMIRLQNLIKSCKRERLLRAKKLIIVMFSKRREIKISKTIKRLFLSIIVCCFRSLNTIQFFREVKSFKSINDRTHSSIA